MHEVSGQDGSASDFYGQFDLRHPNLVPESNSEKYKDFPQLMEDDIKIWAEARLQEADEALEMALEPHFVLTPDTPIDIAHLWLEQRQQHLDGFNLSYAEADMKKASFSKALTANFWGFNKDDITELFSEVTEEQLALVDPKHIDDVLWRKGEYADTKQRTTLDGLAFDAKSYATTFGYLPYYARRVEGRFRAGKEKKEPDYANENEIQAKVLSAIERKRTAMQSVIDKLQQEENSIIKLQNAAQNHNLQYAHMSGHELKDRIMEVVNGSFDSVLQAMKVQLGWDSVEVSQARLAMWKRLFESSDRIAYWQAMLAVARKYVHQKAVRIQKRVDAADRYIAHSRL